MARVVFTGAGASKAIGLPLTSELLGLIWDGISKKTLFINHNTERWRSESLRKLRHYLSTVLPGLKYVEKSEWPLVTEVFSMVDYAIASGELLPIGGLPNHLEFRHLLVLAISDIIYSDFLSTWNSRDPIEARQEQVYRAMLRYLASERRGPTRLISTNYDITLEHELYPSGSEQKVAEELDLGFDWRGVSGVVRTRPAKPTIQILKLHGSYDTLHCPNCGHVYFNHHGPVTHQSFRVDADDLNTCECNDTGILGAHIVSMSLVRDIRDANLLSVWRSALETLRMADEWVIIGYSLPQEDLAIRSLLVRAYHGHEGGAKPKIVVVQQGNKARSAYKALFPDAEYFEGGVENYLIRKRFLSR